MRPDFSTLTPPQEARRLILEAVQPLTDTETLTTEEALGRVLTENIISPRTMPDFRRSTVDGYAVRVADLSPGVTLKLAGEVPMGQLAGFTLEPGQAALIHTGGSLPEGADAVVMVETTAHNGDEVTFRETVSAGDNLIEIGEDIFTGDVILKHGHRLRVQDIGGLLAVGITQVTVAGQPRVVIFSTGDEVIPPGEEAQPGEVYDINSTTIAALTRKAGGIPHKGGILPDDFDTVLERVQAAYDDGADMIVVTAGSSMSERDVTARVFNQVGDVLVHGVATRPGKPTMLGVAGRVPLIGLPGNPISAFVQFTMMAVPVLYRLQGADIPASHLIRATLAGRVESAAGREDYVPARLRTTDDGLLADPIPWKSNLIFKLVEAEGLIKVPIREPHLEPGAAVDVRLF